VYVSNAQTLRSMGERKVVGATMNAVNHNIGKDSYYVIDLYLDG